MHKCIFNKRRLSRCFVAVDTVGARVNHLITSFVDGRFDTVLRCEHPLVVDDRTAAGVRTVTTEASFFCGEIATQMIKLIICVAL